MKRTLTNLLQFRLRNGYREIIKYASRLTFFPHRPGRCLRLAVLQNDSEEILPYTGTAAVVSSAPYFSNPSPPRTTYNISSRAGRYHWPDYLSFEIHNFPVCI